MNNKENDMKKKSKTSKKMLTLLIVVSVSVTELFSHITAYAMDGFGKVSEVVFVDGNKIKVTIDVATGNVVSESVDSGEKSCLEIKSNGESVATVLDEEEGYVDYVLDIEDLSYSDVDVKVIDDNGEIVEEYDEYEDIVEDTYEEQAVAVTVVTGITVGTLITAVLEVAACIVVAGVIYYGAKAAVSAIKKSANKRKYYYKAYIYQKNVFINISKNISTESAVKRIRLGKNVYTYTSSRAKKIVVKTGLGYTAPEISDLRGKIRFYHYHTANRNGAHSFYGLPVTY